MRGTPCLQVSAEVSRPASACARVHFFGHIVGASGFARRCLWARWRLVHDARSWALAEGQAQVRGQKRPHHCMGAWPATPRGVPCVSRLWNHASVFLFLPFSCMSRFGTAAILPCVCVRLPQKGTSCCSSPVLPEDALTLWSHPVDMALTTTSLRAWPSILLKVSAAAPSPARASDLLFAAHNTSCSSVYLYGNFLWSSGVRSPPTPPPTGQSVGGGCILHAGVPSLTLDWARCIYGLCAGGAAQPARAPPRHLSCVGAGRAAAAAGHGART
jgi:hypothetical protein